MRNLKFILYKMHVQKTNSAHKRGSRLIGPIQQVPVDCEQAQLVVPHEFLVETKKLLRQIQMPTIRIHHHL